MAGAGTYQVTATIFGTAAIPPIPMIPVIPLLSGGGLVAFGLLLAGAMYIAVRRQERAARA